VYIASTVLAQDHFSSDPYDIVARHIHDPILLVLCTEVPDIRSASWPARNSDISERLEGKSVQVVSRKPHSAKARSPVPHHPTSFVGVGFTHKVLCDFLKIRLILGLYHVDCTRIG